MLSKPRISGFTQRARSSAALIPLLCALGASAADKPSLARIPTAGQVLDRYVKVTGGAALWHSRSSKREDIEGRTLDGARVVLRASIAVTRSGNTLSEVHVPQEASEGVFRGTAWASSHFSGVRLKRGAERDEAVREARMLEEADWRSLYPKAQLAGTETIAGQRCYKILLLPSSNALTEWFDISTGLLVRRSATEISSAGDTPAGYTVERWTESGGIMQPSTMRAWRGDFEYRVTVEHTQYNDRADSSLRYPAEVAEYVAADRKGKALPNGEELIERHIFESGGPDAWEMLKTQRVTGKLMFVSRNIEARLETTTAAGGRYYEVVDVPGLGKQESGSDGLVAWDRSPIIGPRIKLRGARSELGVTVDAAQMIGWRLLLDQVRTEAEETIEGHDCYRVRLIARNGSLAAIRWFDRATGLLYRTSINLATDMGGLPIMMTFEEYRAVGDIKWPSRTRVAASGQDVEFVADEVKLNEPVDDAVFELPDEIRQLAQKRPEVSPAGSAQ